jgi:hypothetical protein
MTTEAKRTHGALAPEEQQKPKILTTIRMPAKIDEKGRAIETGEDRKLYIEGMEDEMLDELSDDQLAYLEAGGFVSGIGLALPSEKSLSLDPTVRAGATRGKKRGEIILPETATISGPRSQREASTATTVGAAEEADEREHPRRSGKKVAKKGHKKD